MSDLKYQPLPSMQATMLKWIPVQRVFGLDYAVVKCLSALPPTRPSLKYSGDELLNPLVLV